MDLSFLGIYRDIGVDLGTAATLVCVKGKGITLCEPSVVAIDKYTKKVLAVGNEANEMLGRTPENITALCPVRDGVIADFETTAAMLKAYLRRAMGKKPLMKPRVAVAVPSGITDVERRAVTEVALAAGAGSVTLIEEPMAAGLGAGLPVCAAQGSMVVNIGAGTCEAAVISLGGIVSARSVRSAGAALDNSIINYIRHEYSITIGAKTAEEIKIAIGSAGPYSDEGYYEVRGRESATGLPKNVSVAASEIRSAMSETLSVIIDAVLDTLENTPPELAADVLAGGITVTGGGALIRNIDTVIEAATGIRTVIAENPMQCVCTGTEAALSNPVIIRRSEVAKRR